MLLSSVDRLRVMLVTLLLSFAVTGELKAVAAVANLTLAQAQTAQNPKDEADRLLKEGKQKLNQNQFQAALEAFEKALALYQQGKDRKGEGDTLYSIGDVYYYQDKFSQAIEFSQQALVIRRQLRDRTQEGTTLNHIGISYSNLSQYPKALEYLQQALAIRKQIGDKAGVGGSLNNIGFIYKSLGQYPKALEYYQQALAISKQIGDRSTEGTTLNNIGGIYKSLGQYSKALEYLQQALAIRKQIGDRSGKSQSLNNIGLIYFSLGQYPKALEYLQQALAISKQIGDRSTEGTTLNNIGLIYFSLGQYPKALEYLQQALAISKQIGDRSTEGTTLNNIGLIYFSLGQYPKALEYLQQALAISKQIGDRSTEGTTLNNIGLIYFSLGQYPKALEYLQQALAISKQIGDRSTEGTTLNNIGLIYFSLGQYPKALEYLQQALAISKQIGDRSTEGTTLNNIGLIYFSLGQYPKALEYLQQALAISKQIGDRSTEGTTLNNIGLIYFSLGQYPKALEYLQQALAISKQIGDRSTEGTTLNNIGLIYFSLGQYPKALEYLQQALAIIKQIGDRSTEGTTLSNLGFLLDTQKQQELAIVFLKQSVNVTETIRQDLQVLPKEQQESYTKTVAFTYRRLADLLLQKDRVLEAQQVLDLLKVQELQEYLRNVRGNQQTRQGLDNLPPEQKISDSYNQLLNQAIEIGKELTELQKIPYPQQTSTQKQRLAQLTNQQGQIVKMFEEFTRRPDVVASVQQLRQTAKDENVSLQRLRNIADDLKRLEQNAVLLYPLILEDRLELILATPGSPPIRRTVAVKRQDLNQAIVNFRSALQNPNMDAKKPAKQLYDWLIKPIENDLQKADAKTIIYAPDGQLRYIPLAALYDGKQWLVERLRVNNITAASLTDFTTKPQPHLKVLAGAFTQGHYEFQLGKQHFNLSGLPFAAKEVADLETSIPDTTKLLDKDFSTTAIIPQMNQNSVIHFATHAAFVPGLPEDSFILFGNGDRVTLRDIQDKWFLTNVDLMVLSGCETGLGGTLGNGEEILGFGYLMQNAGARAAIASLWSVNDGGTQALMDVFYAKLKQGTFTKAEALRQAQIALINTSKNTESKQRGSSIEIEALPSNVSDRLSHPYYWAPFILIGNGL
ncbi:CHAT domain-containing protein [Nostoc sp. DedSLP04]|uniref:CHAT domain-containing protein n=1 Tax=Nostoc sp. DedSLP04 TaxID=3075401 RepID=UPI002AD42CF5|nr:tetratricopeptide repeat protein [Nostoc sp. DedSLP04]MDZ8032695.1 tetratricopeptide repeat protein [Nostoc sp. DedSLP04]